MVAVLCCLWCVDSVTNTTLACASMCCMFPAWLLWHLGTWLAAGTVLGMWRAGRGAAGSRTTGGAPGRAKWEAAAEAAVPTHAAPAALALWAPGGAQPVSTGHLWLRDTGQPGLCIHRAWWLLHGCGDRPLWGARALLQQGWQPAASKAPDPPGLLGAWAGPGEHEPSPTAGTARLGPAEGEILPGPGRWQRYIRSQPNPGRLA